MHRAPPRVGRRGFVQDLLAYLLTRDQALRIRQLCASSGDEELARIFSVSLEKKRRR